MTPPELDLAAFFAVAERVLGVPATELAHGARVAEAESALAAPHASSGGAVFYADPAERAAILCSRIVRNHPLPDGNKRVAYLMLRLQFDVEGLTWHDPPGGQAEVADVIEALAASDLSEAEFTLWVEDRSEPR